MHLRTKFLLSISICSLLMSSFSVIADDSSRELHKNNSIIARMLNKDNQLPHLPIYNYENNYLIYTYTSNINRKAIQSYSWADGARKDEAKFQISLAFPIYRGIIDENSLLGVSYTQRSWWQAFNPAQSSPFRETNYEPQLFIGFATHYPLLYGWAIKDIELGFNHQSNGRPQQTSRSWNRLYARASAVKDNYSIDFKT